jgi:hypothetical protein
MENFDSCDEHCFYIKFNTAIILVFNNSSVSKIKRVIIILSIFNCNIVTLLPFSFSESYINFMKNKGCHYHFINLQL